MNHLLNLKRTSDPAAPAPAPRRFSSRQKFATVLVLAALMTGWFALRPQPWRAVFLTNNQVYFGKFRAWPFAGSISLRDIYYLQVSQGIQPANGSANQEVKIVKLGQELHGPEDRMVIPKTQILFYEDLRSDSAVVKTIEEYRASHK